MIPFTTEMEGGMLEVASVKVRLSRGLARRFEFRHSHHQHHQGENYADLRGARAPTVLLYE